MDTKRNPHMGGALGRSPGWRRSLWLIAFTCLSWLTPAQAEPLSPQQAPLNTDITDNGLSARKLQEDLAICEKLRKKPTNPVGLGRDRNARYIDGHAPTLIKNATVWTGQPTDGKQSYRWTPSDVYLEFGLIKRVEARIDASSVAAGALVYDARGRPLTAGLIDMHSHAGMLSLPLLTATSDVNEASSPITPYVRSIDGFQIHDPQIQVIKSGGVTTSLILPGSSNNMGGEAYVIKHAVGKVDGRNEASAADMLVDPDRSWRYMKMACGENPKQVHGKSGERGPVSRMGESWQFRQAFAQAAKLVQEQDDWCDSAAAAGGLRAMKSYLPQDRRWEAVVALLRGQVSLHVHCYTATDLEAFVEHTNEFKFNVSAFHHAHQAYLVPETLKRAYGHAPALAIFADQMYYKAEAYVGTEYAGKLLYDSGLTPIYVSDNPVINAQHLVSEAARGYRYGLPYHAAMASITTAPAERLGLGNRLGKVAAGFDADVVVWDSDPLDVGATPVQVWIDGAAQYKNPVELKKSAPPKLIIPDDKLFKIHTEEPTRMEAVIFTGVSSFLTAANNISSVSVGNNVVITKGRITCVGSCAAELDLAAKANVSVIKFEGGGYLTQSLTAFGGTLGLTSIDSEPSTDNGDSGLTFSRAEDGLSLDDKKLHTAYRYGVTKAISAPKYQGVSTLHGTSVGFVTGSATALEDGAVFASDAAVHYTLGHGDGLASSLSAALGTLRGKLLEAVASNGTPAADPYAESAFLQRVVNGNMTLAIQAYSADVMASLLKIKAVVDARAPKPMRLTITGAGESWMVAKELAAADVGVILTPAFSFGISWDERRALTGAPLTNGTAVDRLLEAGVVTAIGIEGDWQVRNLALTAGIVHKNSGGRVDERAALDLVGANVYRILGINEPGVAEGHFVIYEGSPLEIGSRVRAVGGGRSEVLVFPA